VVVVVARIEKQDRTQLLVAPITHSQPERAVEGLEVPPSVKKHLGLDRDPSWIVLTELNRFFWPGPDIRPVSGSESPLYGPVPDWLFRKVQDGIRQNAGGGRLKITKRTE
jgi:hypothetical protein